MGKGNDGISFPHLCQRPNGLGGQETSPLHPYIYWGGAWEPHPFPWRSPLPPQHLLLLRSRAWRSPAGELQAPPPRRRAAGALPQLLLSNCWIKKEETSPGCTCVECGGAVVRCLDRNQPRSESLRVRLPHPRSCNAFASRSTRVCRCTPLPLVARLLHRLILVMRRKF